MAAAMRRRYLDDDNEVFDPKYYPKRVYKDGYGPHVHLMLTDAEPLGTFAERRFDTNDARLHRPHQADLSGSVEVRDAMQAAFDARQSYLARLKDAWRDKSNPPPSAPSKGESPRDAYVRSLQWNYGSGNGDRNNGNGKGSDADDIEAARGRSLSPGARPGSGLDARPANDAAAASDRDRAYAGYLDNLTNAWKRQ